LVNPYRRTREKLTQEVFLEDSDFIKVDLTRLGGHPRVWRQSLREVSPYAEKTESRYPEECKGEAVQLACSSPEKSISQLVFELGISDQTLRDWVKEQISTMASGKA